MTLRELSCAHWGYQVKRREEWDKTRLLAYYSVIAFNGTKQIKKPSDLFLHPWEVEDTPKKVGTRKVLSRDELVESYKRAGIPMTDTQIDLIIEKRGRKVDRNGRGAKDVEKPS